MIKIHEAEVEDETKSETKDCQRHGTRHGNDFCRSTGALCVFGTFVMKVMMCKKGLMKIEDVGLY